MVTDRYVHGSNAAADDPLIWYEGNNLGSVNWLHADHLGSIAAIADEHNRNAQINSYDEYGVPGASNTGRFQYTGQAWLPELKLYYYKARLYSPTLGRFLQTDPVGYEGGINLYGYVGGDPVNGADPSGDCPTPDQQCMDQKVTQKIFPQQQQRSQLGFMRSSSTPSHPAAQTQPSSASQGKLQGSTIVGAVAQTQHSLADAARGTGATAAQVAPVRALGHGMSALSGIMKANELSQQGHSAPASVAGGAASAGTSVAIGAAAGALAPETAGGSLLVGVAAFGVDELLGISDKTGSATADFMEGVESNPGPMLPTCGPMSAAGC